MEVRSPAQRIVLAAVLAAVVVVAIVLSVFFSRYIRTQVTQPVAITDSQATSSQAKDYPEIIAGQVSVRFSPAQVEALAKALDDIKQPAVLAAVTSSSPSPSATSSPAFSASPSPSLLASPSSLPSPSPSPSPSPLSSPSPSTSPVPVSPPTSTPAERVAAAKAAVPALASINFTDISLTTPLAVSGDKYRIPVYRWVTLYLPLPAERKELAIPVILENPDDPTSFVAATPQSAVLGLPPEPDNPLLSSSPAPELTLAPADVAAVQQIKDVFSQLEPAKQAGTVETFEAVHPVYLMSANPHDDTYYDSRGAWGQTDYDDLYGLKLIEAEAAWDISQGEGVTVAVIDTGVDYNHEDLAANIWTNPGEMGAGGDCDMSGCPPDKSINGIDDDGNGYIDDWRGWDAIGDKSIIFGFNEPDPDNDPFDQFGHGSHVAGTIAAVDNDKGVIGVAPKARIMAVKGLDKYGDGNDDTLKNSIIYATSMGANILNNSWGGYGVSQKIEDAFSFSNQQGSISIASAGNYGVNISYIYSLLNPTMGITMVAATDWNNRRASFSNYSANSWQRNVTDKHLAWVDVAAPGVEILSLRGEGTDMYLESPNYNPGERFVPSYETDTRYYRANGTSMASPHVAGVAALVKSRHPEFTNDEVREVLRYAVDEVQTDKPIGTGRINARKAVQINAPPPFAVITWPHPGPRLISLSDTGEAVNRITIQGTAAGRTFTGYSVEVASETSPTSWTKQNITLPGQGTTPVTNGVLATWDISNLPSGKYSLRLTVRGSQDVTYTASNLAIDRTIQNAWLVHPMCNNVENELEECVRSKILAIGEVYGGPKNKEIVSFTAGSAANGISLFKNNGTPVPGWQEIINNISISINRFPILHDFNKDGSDDILIASRHTSAEPHRLYLFQGDGLRFPGWPKDLHPSQQLQAAPLILDTNKDGVDEIITQTYNPSESSFKINSWNAHGGSSLTGWPKEISMIEYGFPFRDRIATQNVATAIIATGNDELLISLPGNHVDCFSPCECYDRGWPWLTSALVRFVPSVSEVLPNWPAFITRIPWRHTTMDYICNSSEYREQDYPSYLPRDAISITYRSEGVSLIVPGNVVGDDTLEYVVTTPAGDDEGGTVMVLDDKGNILSPWPVILPGHVVLSNPTLIDLNEDGLQEIIVGKYAWRGDGTAVPGWPKVEPVDQDEVLGVDFDFYGAITADIDGDYELEIITPHSWERRLGIIDVSTPILYAFNQDGTQVDGWPKVLPDSASSQPLAEDIDGDGRIEIVISANNMVIVYDTPGLACAGTWPLVHKDAQHTRGYGSTSSCPTPSPTPSPTSSPTSSP